MMGIMAVDKEKRPIIIKKIIKGGHGHHGGAWKVAYADFVTAMMAFFLLMWLLGATTDDQRKGIADYFDPISVSSSQSGSGAVMGGKSPNEPGSQISDQAPTAIATTDTPGQQGNEESPPVGKEEDMASVSDTVPKDPSMGQDGLTGEETGKKAAVISEKRAEEIAAEKEQKQFEETKQKIIQTIQNDPNLSGLAKNLIVDETPEGLRIQIIDTDGTPMFESAGTRISASMQKILALVTQAIMPLPNKLSIRGHTDNTPYRGWQRDNWDLSAERANASRRMVVQNGISPDRIANVVGRADKDPLLPQDPKNPQNRRISIIMMREHQEPAAAATPVAGDTATVLTPSPTAPLP